MLQSENIKHTDVMGISYVFDIYSDNPRCEEILNYLRQNPNPFILQEAIYSKEEMQKAEWYEMYATRQVVDTRDWDYTYEIFMSVSTRGRHKIQAHDPSKTVYIARHAKMEA